MWLCNPLVPEGPQETHGAELSPSVKLNPEWSLQLKDRHMSEASQDQHNCPMEPNQEPAELGRSLWSFVVDSDAEKIHGCQAQKVLIIYFTPQFSHL
jgi:hypothetical protein